MSGHGTNDEDGSCLCVDAGPGIAATVYVGPAMRSPTVSSAERLAARAMRSARRSTLEAAAAAAGCDDRSAATALMTASTRGVCDRVSQRACSDGSWRRGLLAVSSRVCPPSARAAVGARPGDMAEQLAAQLSTATTRGGAFMHLTFNAPVAVNSYIESTSDTRSLAAAAADPSPAIRAAVAANPCTPQAVLVALSTDSAAAVREAVAMNPVCGSVGLCVLSGDTQRNPQLAAMSNPSCWAGHLDVLSRSADLDQRRAAASNTSTPAGALARLAYDSNPVAREAVAANPASPPDAISAAVDYNNDVSYVVTGAASNRSAAADLLKRLASHTDTRVRCCVAANPACGPQLLSRLAVDTDWTVRASATSNPEATTEIVQAALDYGRAEFPSAARAVRSQAATSPACPSDVLRLIASDHPTKLDLAAVVANPNCPPELLEQHSTDPGSDAATAAASNPAVEAAALRRLVVEGNHYTAKAAAANPSCPYWLLVLIATHENNSRAGTAASVLAGRRLRPPTRP